jgi:transcriptional regulator with XRE-family HTH domain
MMRTSRNNKPETLGEYVRQKREGAELSQRQLAQEAGVSFSNISRLESGLSQHPTPGLLKNIADVLDVDLAELLAYLGIDVTGSGSLNDYLRRDYDLPDEGVAEAKRAIEEIVQKYQPGRHAPEDGQ